MEKTDVLPLIDSAKDLVNGDPNRIARDFIVVNKDGSTDDDGYLQGEVPLHTNIHNSLAQEILNRLNLLEKRIKSDRKPVSSFSVDGVDKETTPLQVVDQSDIPKYDRYKNAVSGSVMGEMDFEENKDLDFQVVRTKDDRGDTFAALRKFTKKQIVGRSWKIKVALANREYDKFEQGVIGLPTNFDAYYYDGKFLVENQVAFESIFDYFEAYEEVADDVFETLRDSGLNIHNLGEVESSIRRDKRSLRKMHQIENVGIYEDMSLSEAQQKISEYDLGLEIEEVDGEQGVRVSDLRKKYHLLAMFNDDLLVSNMTDSNYLVDGKQKRSD